MSKFTIADLNNIASACHQLADAIEKRRLSMKAAKAVAADANRIELNDEARSLVLASFFDRKEQTIETLRELAKQSRKASHDLYTENRNFEISFANVRRWANENHAADNITDEEISAAIKQKAAINDGTCSQYIKAILSARPQPKTEEQKNVELTRDFLVDQGVRLDSYTPAGLIHAMRQINARVYELKGEMQQARRDLITMETEGDEIGSAVIANQKKRLSDIIAAYGVELARRELVADAMQFNIPQGEKEYRVIWYTDVYAKNYEDAARDVALSYFREGLGFYADDAATLEVLCKDNGWKDADPVVVDLCKVYAEEN